MGPGHTDEVGGFPNARSPVRPARWMPVCVGFEAASHGVGQRSGVSTPATSSPASPSRRVNEATSRISTTHAPRWPPPAARTARVE